jgi:hypothetical protein
MSIASAGDNCFSLLSKSPKKVIAIDISEVQLFLVELKKIAIQRLDYPDVLEFIGVRKSKRRRSIFALLKSHLSANCRAYWEQQVEQIEQGLIHQLANSHKREFTIDLAEQTIVCDQTSYSFEITNNDKHSLLNGIDVIAATMKYQSLINDFSNKDKARRPWLY